MYKIRKFQSKLKYILRFLKTKGHKTAPILKLSHHKQTFSFPKRFLIKKHAHFNKLNKNKEKTLKVTSKLLKKLPQMSKV